MSAKNGAMKVLSNATDLINILARVGPMTAAALAHELDLPRSSAYRLIDGLTAISLIAPVGDGKVRLASRWLQLADATRRAMHEWDDASAVLAQLAHRTGQTAFLSVLSDSAAFCVDWCQGRGIDILATKPGRSLPLNAGASGRVMLAFSENSEHLLTNTPFRAATPETMVNIEQLRADVELTRKQGYSFSDGDAAVGIAGLAVPIFNDVNELAGTVSIAGLARPFRERTEEFARVLVEESAQLQGRPRGYRPTKKAIASSQ
jgi:IclR family acetate operon transcriptional repressor